jgi:hypothetical protein
MNESHAFTGYELRFRPLMAGGRDYRFPCDALGQVDMDSLSERARLNYLYARAVRDLEVERPDVQPCRFNQSHERSPNRSRPPGCAHATGLGPEKMRDV